MPDFLPAIVDAAQKSQADWHVPASVSLAQFAIESAYGTRMPTGSNNPFGIKAVGNQPFVTASTREVVNGQSVQIQAKFRKFADFAEAFDEHARLLATAPVYASAMTAWKAGDLAGGVKLMAAHYATDPNYATTILSVIKSQNLSRYDGLVVAPAAVAVTPAAVSAAQPMSNSIMKAWQQRLLDVAASEGKPDPLPKFGADGLGGRETQAAVIAYQKDHKLTVTGQFDSATRAALNPAVAPHMSSAEVAILLAGLSHLPFVPQTVKDFLMFPTILQLLIALVPGIPDDIAKVRAEIEELASTDSGVAKVRSFIAFARSMLNEAEAVVNKIDPQATIAASTPIPAAVAALAPPTKQP